MVWSDPKIRKIAAEFVTVAEEVHFLFPEGEWALNAIKEKKEHVFFRRFGEQAPKADWNDPGTKQGIYFLGPHAEFLESAPAQSGEPKALLERAERALKKWKTLAKSKKYKSKRVPSVATWCPPEVAAKKLVFRVSLRDLPRVKDDDIGRRFKDADVRGHWASFVAWAWNTNWIGFDDPKVFVTKSKKETVVDDASVRRLCREVLVDNVRGQNRGWTKEQVESVELTMRRIKTDSGKWTIAYRGQASLKSSQQSFAPRLRGEALWNTRTKRFERFELVAIGPRSGRGTFNQRSSDLGPAPMGVVLDLSLNPQSSKKASRRTR